MLIDYDASIDAVDNNGDTALHYAASYGEYEAVVVSRVSTRRLD